MRKTALVAILTAALIPAATVLAQSPGATSPTVPGSPEVGTPGSSGSAQPSPTPVQPAETTRQIQVSSIVEKDLVATTGTELGRIEQVVENNSDKELYLVVSSGGVMGFFEDQAVIPLDEVAVRNDQIVAPNLTEETLKSLPSFEEAGYQDVATGKSVTIVEMK
ncbi:PRC-barrel domain-containing protein [Microvirga sp. BT688]|uniref:PRC-barrel domain-containing protein n=1 Tax=Microvirga sp. TaxID=1873136 RepID=UPI00168615BE|nr:PRC-barrel domain-containing protein [Microvirga sp.]MBD2750336.1 PRC-barrel domain-containing protein [Microvirga sp.]